MNRRGASAQAPARAFKEQEICNTAWALGSLRLPDTDVLDKLLAEVLERGLAQFMPQGVSNLVWACANLGYLNEPFLDVRHSPTSSTGSVELEQEAHG